MSKNTTETKQDFYKAVKNDTYAEYVLSKSPEITIITDWESDGYFNPYVVIPNDYENEQQVNDLICEHMPEIPVYDLLRSEQNNVSFYDIETENNPDNLNI